MQIPSIFIVWACKTVSWISRILRFGSGATWPGEVALRVNPHIFSSFASQFQKGIILVAGTNGKTTTALMIKTILEARGLKVVHNVSGANLENGIVSACIQSANWSGKINAEYGVFEVDENTLPGVISNLSSRDRSDGVAISYRHEIASSRTPRNDIKQKIIIVLLNLFRDQLDRYGEVDVIAEKWEKALESLETQDRKTRRKNEVKIIANADDPLIVSLSTVLASRPGLEAKVRYFGLDDPKEFQKNVEHATDSTFCPHCGARLIYEGYYYSHIGVWKCEKCKAKRPALDVWESEYPLPGLYNRYNTLAAVAVAQILDIKQEIISEALTGFLPAFGRQEEFDVDGKRVKIFLSKNPAGFNQSLRTVIELGAKRLLLVLNDRIPDGRDVSWIWDVDFEIIPRSISIAVSGERAYDLALRLKYAGIKAKIYENLENALATSETLYVLPTYSAMLEIRKLLLGRKIPLTIL